MKLNISDNETTKHWVNKSDNETTNFLYDFTKCNTGQHEWLQLHKHKDQHTVS